ncbi:hypothetical protein SAMN05920897_10358 [Alkalispirochaeta americana]|uniref:J domain-containing protein n=1 Tax=Alkalispirochaeta americana TaxID=159291 RepID=A0A1N6PN87_9SPIO|nr:J domain-containing protein [Alkalispirochaeta americana]SIQ05797.1 hypothetical protein SAMN05920897_10358 [Alkalispirochaeta americana]
MRIDEAFRELGISPDTPVAEVRRRYRRLVKELHPDAAGGASPAEALRSARVARVVQAYRRICGEERSSDAEGRASREGSQRIFLLGRTALESSSRKERLQAVQELGASGKRIAALYLQRAIADKDADIAARAAQGFLRCAGVRVEEEALELFDQLPASRRVLLVEAIPSSGRPLPRLLACARIDSDERVRRAVECLSMRPVRPGQRSA